MSFQWSILPLYIPYYLLYPVISMSFLTILWVSGDVRTRFFAYRALGAMALALPVASQDQDCLSQGKRSGIPSGEHRKSYGKSPFLWENPLFLWPFFNSYVKLPEGNYGSLYCNMNFQSWGMMISWQHMTTWENLKIDVLPNQPMAMPYGSLWLGARWCRNSLSRCRTRRHQTVHAWVLWPVWHCWQSSEKAREAVKSWSREGRSSVFEVLGSCNYRELLTRYILTHDHHYPSLSIIVTMEYAWVSIDIPIDSHRFP